MNDENVQKFMIAVVGSRSFKDEKMMDDTLDIYFRKYGQNLIIRTGTSVGADAMALDYAQKHGLECHRLAPDFSNDGNLARIRRDRVLARSCSEVIAFWDGTSPRTKNMIDAAMQENTPLRILEFKTR